MYVHACRLEKERRAVEADARARDVRLQRALDEVARYKALLEELKSQVPTDIHTYTDKHNVYDSCATHLLGVAA